MVGLSDSMSTPSRQRTLTATIFLPSGISPRANDSIPQAEQNRWAIVLVLKRYSVRLASPFSSSKFSAGVKARILPRFWQYEQLQVIGLARSTSTLNETAPQWQPPRYCIALSSFIPTRYWLRIPAALRRMRADRTPRQ